MFVCVSLSKIALINKFNQNTVRNNSYIEPEAFIIIIIALQSAIRDCYNLLTAPRTVSNTYVQVARALSCANHVQHIGRLSRAKCRDTCHGIRRDSSATKFDRVETAFILAFFWGGGGAEPLIDKRGEETGVPGENPWRRASENATY